MPSLADMLSPSQRHRLAGLGSPPTTAELAAAAREAAADSTGSGRIAWVLVAHALNKSADIAQARQHLAGTVIDDKLRTLALACLGSLTSAHDPEGTP